MINFFSSRLVAELLYNFSMCEFSFVDSNVVEKKWESLISSTALTIPLSEDWIEKLRLIKVYV